MTTKLDYALRLAELDKVCQGDPSGMNHLFDCAGSCGTSEGVDIKEHDE